MKKKLFLSFESNLRKKEKSKISKNKFLIFGDRLLDWKKNFEWNIEKTEF